MLELKSAAQPDASQPITTTNPEALQAAFTSFEARIVELEQRLLTQAQEYQATVKYLEQRLANVTQMPGEDTSFSRTPPTRSKITTSRRKLLKKMGLAAATLAATSAAALTFGTNEAQAASGDNLLLGNSNIASDLTYLSQSGGTTPNVIFHADNNTNSATTLPANLQAGLAGTSSAGHGIYGATGSSSAYGIYGSNSATGGYAGYFDNKVKIQGNLETVDGQGLVFPGSSAGLPTSPALGQLYYHPSWRALFVCTNATGSVWKQVSVGEFNATDGFPSSPTPQVGLRVYRSDRNREYVYTGITSAVWQTTQIHYQNAVWRTTIPIAGTGATTVADFTLAQFGQYSGTWIESLQIAVYSTGGVATMDASNNVSWGIYILNSAGNSWSSNILTTGANNQGQASNQWYRPAAGIYGATNTNRVVPNNSNQIYLAVVNTGNVGSVYLSATVGFRGIG